MVIIGGNMFKKISILCMSLIITAIAVNSIAAPARDIQIYFKPFAQIDPLWSSDIYGCKEDQTAAAISCRKERSHKTIGGKGCAVTSMAMLYRAYGMYFIPDKNHNPILGRRNLDPGTLDDYLADNFRGYDSSYKNGELSVDMNWIKTTNNVYYLDPYYNHYYQYVVPKYDCSPYEIVTKSKKGKIIKSTKNTSCFKASLNDDKAKKWLDKDLDDKNPPVMKISWINKSIKGRSISHPMHFVVIGGYDLSNSSYRAYNPMFIDNYNDGVPKALTPTQYDGEKYVLDQKIDLYRFTGFYNIFPIDTSTAELRVHSPVEIQVVDPDGYITGYDPETETYIQENPMAMYYAEGAVSSIVDEDEPGEPVKNLTLIQPGPGNYILKLFGTGDGPYTIDMEWTKSDGTPNLVSTLTGTATPSLSETYRVSYSPTGEASLSQTNQPPIADAGSNQAGEQSYEIALDGSASQDPDGDPLKYSWSFVSKPDGSTAALSDPSAIAPTFTPDKSGIYVLQLVLNDHFTDSDPVTVTITATPVKSRIAIEPNFSQPLSAGFTTLSFDVSNIGRVAVSSGVIDLSVKDPDGALISVGSQAFSAPVGQSTTVSVPVTIPSLKFGNYTLTYTQSDETRTGNPTTVNVPNSAIVAFSFDKPSYRVRDTANLTLNVLNTGKFNIDNVSVAVLVPDAGYAGTQTISIGQETLLGSYVIQIPDTITAGQHNLSATLALPSGGSATQNSIITIQESELVIRYSGPTDVAAGDIINLTIENTGGVDTSYTTQKLALKDSSGIEATVGTLEGSILSGEMKTLAVKIPPQAARGYVVLSVILNDIKLGKQTIFYKSLYVDGIEASLDSKTENDVYLNTEVVKAINTITSGSVNIENGTLNLKVVKYRTASGGGFSQFLPKTTNGSFNYPNRIAISPDGFIYVADSSNYRIQKFDSNGNFITKWGNYGSGDGQFNWGQGIYAAGSIAVSYDGSVYVADTYNNRIQKFDGNGNFIGKWGISGGGNGQIKQPYDIVIGSDGSVYVADGTDSSSYRVQKFDSNGNFFFKVMGNGNFGNVTDMTVAPDGAFYIADNYFTYSGGRSRIQKFNNSGNYMSTWKNYSDSVSPRTTVNNGYIYVATGVEIQKFSTNGNFISKWGSSGANNGQFYFRIDLVLGSDGFVYVADSGNARIQKFDGNGNFNSKWGNEISLKSLGGIAISDSIYVVDTYSYSINKFDHNGEFIVMLT